MHNLIAYQLNKIIQLIFLGGIHVYIHILDSPHSFKYELRNVLKCIYGNGKGHVLVQSKCIFARLIFIRFDNIF